jgi:hypothetical protein
MNMITINSMPFTGRKYIIIRKIVFIFYPVLIKYRNPFPLLWSGVLDAQGQHSRLIVTI